MTPPRGPFAVIVRRTADGWWRVTGLYQSRPPRVGIGRSVAGHLRDRPEAATCAAVVLR